LHQHIVYVTGNAYRRPQEVLLACWLVEHHGIAGEEALDELAHQAAHTRQNYLRRPPFKYHRGMVRRWNQKDE